jgi:heme exporter protein C
MREKIIYAMGALAAILLVRNLYVILIGLPDEAAQGAIYRIIFFHVPPSFTAATLYVTSAVASILYLTKRDFKYDVLAVSAVEVGLAFAAVNLITGMIWARIIWGIWWTWDARLTWALISWLIYAGYLMLRDAIDEPTARARNSSVLSIFALATVLITYKAIDWWRTQHPGPVLSIRGADGRMDPAMERMLYLNWIPMLLLAGVFLLIRMRQEQTQREIEALRRYAHSY